MKERHVSVDFDGTLTDLSAIQDNYIDAFWTNLSNDRDLALPGAEKLIELARRQTEIVMQNPKNYGWEINGVIVAAPSDPFIINNAVTTHILEQLKSMGIQVPFEKLVENHNISYQQVGEAPFREDAKEFMRELTASSEVSVITNSETETIKNRVASLFGDNEHNVKVVGDAKKYSISKDVEIDTLPSFVEKDGFPRPVYLKRPQYHKALQEVKPDVVIGDIYELDLALPEAMGVRTILLATPFTPGWEREYYQNKGELILTLSEAKGIL